MGDGKAPPFPDWKNLLHGVCWYILCISLVFSQVASQWLIVQLRKWKNSSRVEAEKRKNDSQVAAVMLLSIVVFITGLSLIFFAWSRSSFEQDYYMWAFFISAMLVLARRALWCFLRIYKSDNIDLHKLSLTKGHESDPSGNYYFLLHTLPSNIHGLPSFAVDIAGRYNRTILGYFSFSGCHFCFCYSRFLFLWFLRILSFPWMYWPRVWKMFCT